MREHRFGAPWRLKPPPHAFCLPPHAVRACPLRRFPASELLRTLGTPLLAMTTILIVSDIRLYREGLVDLLRREPGFVVVGAVRSFVEAQERIAGDAPNVVLLDVSMSDSLIFVRQVARLAPGARLVALGVPETDNDVIACAEAGIVGYIARDGSLEDLRSAIQSVERGELLCSPRVAATLLRRIATLAASSPRNTPVPPASALTRRELQILHLIEDGLTNKEIAVRLGIEVATVKNHVHNLLEKLRVHRRADAAAYGRRLPRRTPPEGSRIGLART